MNDEELDLDETEEAPGIGHNSDETKDDDVEVGGIAGSRLRSFVERIERLEEEKTALSADVREVYSEAKGTGFDVKVLRALIKIRKVDYFDLQEFEEILELYKTATGFGGNS